MSEEFSADGAAAGGLVAFDRSQFMPAMSIELAVDRYNAVTEFVSRVLRRDIDYGVIPGTEKRTLLKPGAEKLTTFFGLSTRFQLLERIEDWTGSGHDGEPFFYYLYRCRLYRGELLIAESDGSCNSREQKYRYREAQRACPSCGQACIIKGREEYGGGRVQPALLRKAGVHGVTMHHNEARILAIEDGPVTDVVDIQTSTGTFFAAGLATHNCFKKKGGCGAKFADGDQQIESQQTGRVCNPDIADQVNTIQKMAQKRSLVGAVLLAVNASEFFTQDVEDMPAGSSFVNVNATAATGAGAEVEEEIRAACRALGKTEAQLSAWVSKKYGAAGVWELTEADRREVLSMLRGMVARRAA